MSDPTSNFVDMMALEAHGPDVWVGVGPRYPWGGLYGGQIVAQALRAASATVASEFRVHSLHAYFIRAGGDHAEPVRYEVDRVRNGRSFATRTVVARQAVGAILSLSASFQIDEDAPEVQTAELPVVPTPEGLQPSSWSPMYDRRIVASDEQPGVARGWVQLQTSLGVDPVLNACALAYMSDDFPTDAVVAQHPLRPGPGAPDDHPFIAFSLDHAIWFHRPVDSSEWHLHDLACQGLISSRGLAVGHVFTDTGVHVATISQEVLLRGRRT